MEICCLEMGPTGSIQAEKMKKKKCTKCHKRKNLSKFYKQTEGKYGLRASCKKCEKIYHRQRYIYLKLLQKAQLKPVPNGWFPKAGERFSVYLRETRAKCILSPFLCEANEERRIIATSHKRRWQLDKTVFGFYSL